MDRDQILQEIEKAYTDRLRQRLEGPGTMGFGQENLPKIEIIMERMKNLPSFCKSLSLPKRRELDGYKDLLSAVGGNFFVALEIFIESKLPGHEIVGNILYNQKHLESMRAANISKTSLEALVMQLRYEQNKGAFFSLREGLNQALMDMDIGDKVPANMFRTPFDYVYIEFEEAENRERSGLKSIFKGQELIVEGAYIINNDDVELSKFSNDLIEELELDRNKPARLIEVCITASPYGSENIPVFGDLSNIIPIFIQDEDEPLIDILERTIRYTMQLNESAEHRLIFGSLDIDDKVIDSMEVVVKHLTKALLYINSDKSISELKNEKTDLESQLSRVASKKKDKIKKRIVRSYDRIIVGPTHKYIPIKDIIERNHSRMGGVKPHYRRGVIGVRWTGKGRKIAKATWIKPTIVNKNQLIGNEDYMKDYYVFL